MAENHYEDPVQFQQTKPFHLRVVRLGIAHLAVGIATVAIGVMDVSFSSIAYDVFSVGASVTGIWIGSVILLTAAACFVSSRSEVRRRTANIAFVVLSFLSWFLSIVMIGIAISEIASSEFAEGSLSKEKELRNVTDCLNVTTNDQTPVVRCIPTTTFDQKLAASSILVACGYIESMVAFFSLLTAISIAKKETAANQTENFGLPGRERVDVPSISVDAYFEERLRQEQQFESNSNHRHTSQDGSVGFSMHVSPSQGEFPDSKQFREHLETLES